ncbi:MAG: CD1871A family CXXC motif-containing protein [Oscillospiraceae bacterium]
MVKRFLNSTSIKLVAIIIGVVFFIAGILRNEFTIVFEKAINICLECIGIG